VGARSRNPERSRGNPAILAEDGSLLRTRLWGKIPVNREIYREFLVFTTRPSGSTATIGIISRYLVILRVNSIQKLSGNFVNYIRELRRGNRNLIMESGCSYNPNLVLAEGRFVYDSLQTLAHTVRLS